MKKKRAILGIRFNILRANLPAEREKKMTLARQYAEKYLGIIPDSKEHEYKIGYLEYQFNEFGKKILASQVEPVVMMPKPSKVTFTYEDLEKAYNDGYKNGMMNEAGLECTLFSSWYNWVHEIKGKNRSEA